VNYADSGNALAGRFSQTRSTPLWLIPKPGWPIPAGVYKPNERGNAIVIHPPLPAGVEAKSFAITIEPENGSSVPTMPIEMMGAGEQFPPSVFLS
jgi:anti-sigma-K factor RskA